MNNGSVGLVFKVTGEEFESPVRPVILGFGVADKDLDALFALKGRIANLSAHARLGDFATPLLVGQTMRVMSERHQ